MLYRHAKPLSLCGCAVVVLARQATTVMGKAGRPGEKVLLSFVFSGMAPDILRGLCPPPCDNCKKKQIQKVMSTIAKNYPREWNQMVQQVGK